MPVMDKDNDKKSTLMVDEEELIKISEKIRLNHQEEQTLEENLHKLLAGDKAIASQPLTVGKTPLALAICGANGDLDLTIKKSVVDKCLRPEVRDENGRLQGKTGHGLTEEQLLQALNGVKNPAMIIEGSRDGSLIAVTDLKDQKDREIIVAIELNKTSGFQEVNQVSSAYGRENFADFLDRQMEQGKIIAVNEEKANDMLHSIGKKYPKENTFISFDNSIAYSTQNVKTPDEKSSEITEEKSSISLMPVLNAIHQKHEDRIDSLQEKRETRENKIAKNTVKLDKLTAKVERLQQTNAMLKSLSGGVLDTPIQALIQRNQRRIDKIQNTSIPNRQAKIEKHVRRIDVIDRKIAVSQVKADKIQHLNNAIKSFTVRNPEERRQQFTQSMDGLQDASKRTLAIKIEKCDRQIANLSKAYGLTASSMEQLSIGEKIQDIQARKQALSVRMEKLNSLERPFVEHSPEQLDNLITQTEKVVDKVIETGDTQPALLAETMVTQGADYLRNTELSMEQNGNSIDGIVNNLPTEKDVPEQSEQSKEPEEKETVPNEEPQSKEKEAVEHAEQSANIKQNDNNIDNVINNLPTEKDVSEEQQKSERTETIPEDISEQSKQSKDSVKEENWLSSLVDSGAAKINKDGTFCINPDYYHQVPAEAVHMESFQREHAMGILENLAAMGISFTALSLTDTNIATIVVDNRDTTALNEFAEIVTNSIQERAEEKQSEQIPEKKTEVKASEEAKEEMKAPQSEKTTKEPLKVNPEYYTSLPKQERVITNKSRDAAEKIMQSLDSQNIPYSAVERSQGETIAITVSKENEQAFRAIESDVKAEHGKEFINPEFYKELPKEERYTQRMTESEARQAIQELKQEGVEHSAIIDGDKSKITVHKKDKGAVFFSRKQLHKQHEKLQRHEKEKPQPQKKKEKQKGEVL